MAQQALRLEVLDSVFDPNRETPDARDHVVRYFERGGQIHYRVWIYLAGPDLPYVGEAEYRLHPSFPDPVRRVKRTPVSPDCRQLIWTWGLFPVTVEIRTAKGATYTIKHQLSYDREFKDAKFEPGEPRDPPRLAKANRPPKKK